MIKKRSLIFVVVLCIMVSIVTVGCGEKKAPDSQDATTQDATAQTTAPETKEPSAGKKVTVLKISTAMNVSDPSCVEFVDMQKRILERTDGTLDVQVFPNNQLGAQKDNLDQILKGANIIAYLDPSIFSDYVADFGILAAPFLLKSPNDLDKLAQSDWFKEMQEVSREKGFEVLAMDWYYGTRHTIGNRAIQKPDDFKGMSIRTPTGIMWIETFKALGASPTVVQLTELATALEQKVVDGCEGTLIQSYQYKFHELVKEVSLTGHFLGIGGLIMSPEIYDSLTDTQKQVLMEEIAISRNKAKEETVKMENETLELLKNEGANITECDLEALEKACQVVYTKFPQWSPGLYEKVSKMLKD